MAVTKHGQAWPPTPAYRVWLSMRTRCNNPKYNWYYNYGGRGIAVCVRWDKFENFFEDMGPPPKGLWLERLDNDGDYEPGNCAWKTPSDNARNTRHSKFLTFKGETRTQIEWSEVLGISVQTLSSRFRYGWSVDKVLGTPVKSK